MLLITRFAIGRKYFCEHICQVYSAIEVKSKKEVLPVLN
jgi:hypothetical protein